MYFQSIYLCCFLLFTLIVIITTSDETVNLTKLINHWNRNQLRSYNKHHQEKINYNQSDFKGSPIIISTTISNLTEQFDYTNNQVSSSLNNQHYYQDHEALIKAFLDLLLAYRINRLPNLQDTQVIEGAANGFKKWIKQLNDYIESNPDLIIFGSPINNTTVFGETRRLFNDWVKMRGQSMSDWWKTITKYSTTPIPIEG